MFRVLAWSPCGEEPDMDCALHLPACSNHQEAAKDRIAKASLDEANAKASQMQAELSNKLAKHETTITDKDKEKTALEAKISELSKSLESSKTEMSVIRSKCAKANEDVQQKDKN